MVKANYFYIHELLMMVFIFKKMYLYIIHTTYISRHWEFLYLEQYLLLKANKQKQILHKALSHTI